MATKPNEARPGRATMRSKGQEEGKGMMPNASHDGETLKTPSLFAIQELVEHPATCE
jgi:hypothetical protein